MPKRTPKLITDPKLLADFGGEEINFRTCRLGPEAKLVLLALQTEPQRMMSYSDIVTELNYRPEEADQALAELNLACSLKNHLGPNTKLKYVRYGSSPRRVWLEDSTPAPTKTNPQKETKSD